MLLARLQHVRHRVGAVRRVARAVTLTVARRQQQFATVAVGAFPAASRAAAAAATSVMAARPAAVRSVGVPPRATAAARAAHSARAADASVGSRRGQPVLMTDFTGSAWHDTVERARALLAVPSLDAIGDDSGTADADAIGAWRAALAQVLAGLTRFREQLQVQLFVGVNIEALNTEAVHIKAAAADGAAVADATPAHARVAHGVFAPNASSVVAQAHAVGVFDAVVLTELALALRVMQQQQPRQRLPSASSGASGGGGGLRERDLVLALLPWVRGAMHRHQPVEPTPRGRGVRRVQAARLLREAYTILQQQHDDADEHETGDGRSEKAVAGYAEQHRRELAVQALRVALEQCAAEANTAVGGGAAPAAAAYAQALYRIAAPHAAAERYRAKGLQALVDDAAPHRRAQLTDALTGRHSTLSSGDDVGTKKVDDTTLAAALAAAPPRESWAQVATGAERMGDAELRRQHAAAMAAASSSSSSAAAAAVGAEHQHAPGAAPGAAPKWAAAPVTFTSHTGATVALPNALVLDTMTPLCGAAGLTGADALLHELEDVLLDGAKAAAAASAVGTQPYADALTWQWMCARAALYVRGHEHDPTPVDVDDAVAAALGSAPAPPKAAVLPVCPFDELKPLWVTQLPLARAAFGRARGVVHALHNVARSPVGANRVVVSAEVVHAIDTVDALTAADLHGVMAHELLARSRAQHDAVVTANDAEQHTPLYTGDQVLQSARDAYAHARCACAAKVVPPSRVADLQRLGDAARWYADALTAYALTGADARASGGATTNDVQRLHVLRDMLCAKSSVAYSDALHVAAEPAPNPATGTATGPDRRALWLAREQLLLSNTPDDSDALVRPHARVHAPYGVTTTIVPDALPLVSHTGVFDADAWHGALVVRARGTLQVLAQQRLNPADANGAMLLAMLSAAADDDVARASSGVADALRAMAYSAWADAREAVSSGALHRRDARDCIDATVHAFTLLQQAVVGAAKSAPAGSAVSGGAASAPARAAAAAAPFALATPEQVHADLLLCHAAGMLGAVAVDALNAAAPTVLPPAPAAPADPASAAKTMADAKRRAVALIDTAERDLLAAVPAAVLPVYRARTKALRAAAATL